jgi:hypothetical protein
MDLSGQSEFMRIFFCLKADLLWHFKHDLVWSAVSGKSICLIILEDWMKPAV